METLATALNKLGQIEPEKQSCEALNNSVTLKHDMQSRRQLSHFLFQCFDVLKLYGKEPEQLENINTMFQVILADYPYSTIRDAFAYYLRYNSDLPTPADIAIIIERGNKPPFSEAVYVSISKKHPEERDSDEWQYMREYEHFIRTGKYV